MELKFIFETLINGSLGDGLYLEPGECNFIFLCQ